MRHFLGVQEWFWTSLDQGQLISLHMLGFDGCNHRFLICLRWERAQITKVILLLLQSLQDIFCKSLLIIGVVSFGFCILLQSFVTAQSANTFHSLNLALVASTVFDRFGVVIMLLFDRLRDRFKVEWLVVISNRSL